MSIESMAIALHHSRAKGTAKLVLLGIANHDGDGGAWPTVATLARYGHCSVSQVQRSITELERLGEIRRYVQAGGDHRYAEHQRPNRYSFLLRCPADCDRTSQHRTTANAQRVLDLEPEQLAGLADDPVAPMRPVPPVAPTRPGRADATTPGRTHATQTTLSTNQSPKRRTSGFRARDAAPCGHELVDDRHCTHGCRPASFDHPSDEDLVDYGTGEVVSA